MRRTLQLGIALFVCIAVATLAVWQVPQWLDWTRYRGQLATLASATLSRPVSINGPISLTLLPQPTLIAADVGVGGDDRIAVHVGALRLRVALWPLLAGRVDARELVLRGADLSIPWPAAPGTVPHTPRWLAAFAARIEDGRLTIGKLAFTGIDASLETHDTGALSAAGTAHFGGEEWHFLANLTSAGADGASGLNVVLDGRGNAAGTGARFSGQFAADGSLAGTLSAGGPNLAVLLPAPAVQFRADGRLTVGGGLAVADELALEIGGSPASGAVALRLAPEPRLDIALAAGRLDLDGWLPVLLRAGNTVAASSLPVGIDLSAEAARLGGGTLQRLRAAFELAGDTLHVRQAAASLPGDASLDLSGDVARGDPLHPRFAGHVSLHAPVLRTTLRWLRDVMPTLLPQVITDLAGELQHAVLAANVSMSGDALSLRGLSGQLDDRNISGGLDYIARPASVSADLTIDRLALDHWLTASLPADLTHYTGLIDGELRLAVQHATWRGSDIGGLSLDAASAAGNLLLRRFDGGSGTMHFAVSGSVAQSGRVTGGRLQLATEQAATLLPLLPPEWRMNALWHGPLSIDADAAGPPDALVLHIRVAVADASLNAQPVVNLHSDEWKATVTLRHPGARRFAATLGLPARIDWPGLPAWLGDGSFALVAHLSGAPDHTQADSFDLVAGSLHADGRLSFEQADRPTVSGRLHLDALSLPAPAAGSAVPLPRAVLSGWQAAVQIEADRLLAGDQPLLRDVGARVTVADGVLHVGELAGSLAGGRISGDATYDARAVPSGLMVQATLNGATVDGPSGVSPIDLLSGTVNGSIRISASGNSPVALLSTLSGQATLHVTDGVVSGFDLFRVRSAARLANRAAAQASASEAATTGTTGFDRLDLTAHLAHGELLVDQAALTSSAGEADASGTIGLSDRTIDATLVLTPALFEPPAIAVRLNGPLDRTRRTPELAGLARWFAERAR